MRYQILGPLEVTLDGQRVPLGGPKQRLVLAHLLIRANEVVSADLLIDEIWGEEPPDAARASLQSYVSHLRSALGADRLVGRAPGYILRASSEEIDAARFEALVTQARRLLVTDPASGVRILNDALRLWQGEPLADLANELSLQPEIERLSAVRLGAIEDRIEADLALGRHSDLLPELERLVGRHPLRERLYGQLMLALYRAGRQAEALTAYYQLRGALDAQMGLDPSPALEVLQRQILNHDAALDLRGEPLRGYRIVEQIGSGPLGVVHRAFEPQTERDVAIKVLGARVANEPDFVRRFDAEARQVARLEHPHIAPLYDWWREPDAAYLVMRLMTGGSLADRLAAGQVTSASALHWTEQIGAALDAGHRQGLVHGDVRPGNVIFDGDDNAYLTDFAIGFDPAASGSSKRSSSEMRYLAPERRTGATPSSAADIYAMGVVVGELLDGATPLEAEIALGPILERATSETPTERQPTAIDLAAAVRTAVLAPTGIPASVDRPGAPPRNPFKGLRAFEEADAADFFGRDALVDQLVARLIEGGEASRLLAVVGPSGSGKSSVVNAGLIPALREGAVPGSDEWFVASMTPGPWPFDQLERALLSVAVDAPASLAELLNADEGLRPSVERSLPPGTELLLVIDQFEELFTLAEPELRERFLDTLARTIEDEASRVRVVITLRADFYDRPLRHERFGRQLAARTHAVPPLTPEELERVVAAPAERARLQLEQGLVARIVADVSEQTGGLPLLQYALTELWEGRDGSRLSLRAYDASGGIAGAVGRRAEHLVRQLDAGESEAARQLFLRLVEPGEGTPDTSRRVRTSELETLSDERGRMAAVIESFARYRLLLFDRDAATREPTLELAHEALLRAWPRLQRWVDDARDDLRNQRHLAAAAAQWAEAGRDTSFLLTGSRLELTDEWAASTQLLLTSADHEYLAASVAERRRLEAEEEERRGREVKLEQRGLNRLRALVLVMGIGALLAGGLSVIALNESQRASREARFATARELAAAAVSNLTVDPERSLLLALQALETTRQDETVLPEAVQTLHDAVAADRLLFTMEHPSTANVEWSPDGRLLATGGSAAGREQTDVLLWDARTGEKLRTLSGHSADIDELAFSPDSSRLVTNSHDGQMIVWDTRTGERLLTFPAGTGGGANFSPDGRRLVVGGSVPAHASLQIVDAKSGEILKTLVTADDVGLPIYSPDGTLIAVPRNENVSFYDAETGSEVRTFPTGGSWIVVFSPDWSRILIPADGGVAVLDALTGDVAVRIAVSHVGVDWSADGRLIATGGNDGTARIWDAATGEEKLRLAGHRGGVALVGFSPDGTRLLTGGTDGTARVWDITPTATAEWLGAHEGPGRESVSFSPDGRSLLTGGWCRGWLWDTGTRTRMRAIPDACGPAAFGAQGATVARVTCESDCEVGLVKILDAITGKELSVIDQVKGWPASVAVSPDGTMIATAGDQPAVWDASSGNAILHDLGEPGEFMNDVALSPDGTALAGITELATLHLWGVPSGEELLNMQAQGGFGAAVAFGPDGSKLATAGADGATVWSSSGERLVSMTGAGRMSSVAFSADGKRVATAGADGTGRIWDPATGEQLLVLKGHTGPVNDLAFSPDGTRLATVSGDGTLRVYVLPVDELVGIARARLSRGFSNEECRQYLHLQACPPSTSPAPSPPPQPAAPPVGGPEGAYRVSVAAGDLPKPALESEDWYAGDYTLSLVDGTWRLHLDRTRLPVSDDNFSDEWSGPYMVSGDRIVLVVESGGDPGCLGSEVAGRWAMADQSAISFAGMAWAATDSCATFQTEGDVRQTNDAWLRTIFESDPWIRIP